MAEDSKTTTDRSIVETIASSKIPMLRIRVVNRESGIFKDLLVEVRDDDDDDDDANEKDDSNDDSNPPPTSVFDAIYDHPLVKQAGVRKWSPDTARTVRSGTREIACSVWESRHAAATTTNNNNNGASNNPALGVYSVRDLKTTTLRELLDRCCSGNNIDGAGGGILLELSCVEPQTLHRQPPPTSHNHHPGIPMHHPAIGDVGSGGGGKILRCPFSGIAFDESVLEKLR